MAEPIITATEVLKWLDTQELLYASWPAPDGKRVRMIYAPRIPVWKVVLSGQLLYAGNDLSRAVEVFNTNAGE